MRVGIAGTLTSTVAVAVDNDFCYLGHARSKGIIWWLLRNRGERMRRLRLVLDDLAAKLLGPEKTAADLWPKIENLAVGICGTDFRYDTSFLDEGLRLEFHGEIIHSSIGEVAYCGAALMRPGILIRGGTGACVYGVTKDGKNHITNAWDPILGDQGGWLVMTMRLLSVAARYEDRRLCSPAAEQIHAEVIGTFGCSSLVEMHEQLLRKQEASGTSFNDAFFLLGGQVFALADSENAIALQIIDDAASELIQGVKAVLVTLFHGRRQDVPIFLSGNVLCTQKTLQEAVVRHLHALQIKQGVRLDYFSGKYAPAVGAVLFASAAGRQIPQEDSCEKILGSLPPRTEAPELYCPDPLVVRGRTNGNNA